MTCESELMHRIGFGDIITLTSVLKLSSDFNICILSVWHKKPKTFKAIDKFNCIPIVC